MLNYIFYCLTNLCFVKKTGNEKAPFRLVFDITAQSCSCKNRSTIITILSQKSDSFSYFSFLFYTFQSMQKIQNYFVKPSSSVH